MNRFQITALWVTVAAASLIGRPALAITFGEVDVQNRFSNVGTIVVISGPPEFDYPVIAGTGTLIHPRVLLTAGYVTSDIQAAIASGRFAIDDGRVSSGSMRSIRQPG